MNETLTHRNLPSNLRDRDAPPGRGYVVPDI
jgi:hypothetical protein